MSHYRSDLFADPDQAILARDVLSKTIPHPNETIKNRAEGGSTLARLRERVARIERGRISSARLMPPLATGFPVVDRALAAVSGGEAGLAAGAVHGIAGSAGDTVLLRLLTRLMARDARPVLWVVPWAASEQLYGPGLAQAGLDTARLIITRARKPAELLWALEEGLRSGALAGGVGMPEGRLSLTASRRLQLAAETGGGFGFLLTGGDDDMAAPSALHSRWHALPLPSEIRGDGSVERLLNLALHRHRGGARGNWRVSV